LRNLISGAAGFIGSHLCDRLIQQGDTVVAVDNLITGHRDNIGHLLSNPAFHFIEHDICRPLEVQEKVDVGSIGTRNMLEIARKHNARFLLTSTSECYGDPLEHPQVETYWGNVNPVGLRSCYDESKRYAEALTMAFHRKFGMRTTIARIFNTYGPRMALNDGRVVPAFLDQALRGEDLTVFGDGSQTRSFCYVSDLVEGLLRLVESSEAYPVNLGNPNEMTILEFADYIREKVGNSVGVQFKPLPSDDPKIRRPDISKAKRVLGWEPRVHLEEGIRKTVEHFRERIFPLAGAAR
jgi:dTDP-glucose 4,6-dehydratase